MSSRVVLVTGATGFLGGRLAAVLLERGASVRALCRQGSEARLPEGVEPVAGDVTDAASVDRAARGASAILHAAARVTRGGTWQDFERVNVGGLRNVLHAAAACGVERVVYTSSFFALGPSDMGAASGTPVDEKGRDRDCPVLDHYQASKHHAALLAGRAAQAGAPLVTLYPGVIVGPGRLTEGNFVTAMLRDHLSGRLVPLPMGGRLPWSYVHVEDVVKGHLAALERAQPSPAYVLGGENRSLRELFAEVASLTGVAPPRFSAPSALLWSVGFGEEIAEACFGRTPRQLTRGVARVLARAWALDSSLAARELGHAPRTLRSTLSDTIAWLEREGHVRGGMLAGGAAGGGRGETPPR